MTVPETVAQQKLDFGPRRGVYLDVRQHVDDYPTSDETIRRFEDYDLIYRTLCGILFNFAPTSGHPGGSVSSGRIVAGLLLQTMDYLFEDPTSLEADVISYAAGHKAMGLYAMWALRNECVRIARPHLLPAENLQLRFEDLLGFRKNPTQETPLFAQFNAKPLDGHPTPQTPFLRLATGASGVGVPASFGLGLGAMDAFGEHAPLVHVLEGEGGMTTGRVSEALATAATAQLWNICLHVDWNQASIDSDQVCRDGERPGDYVQWNPAELCYLNDWNVIFVENGRDYRQVLAAQALAKGRLSDQPTAIVYRTVKGWAYGIEGRKSHGAGHSFCSDEYYAMLAPLQARFGVRFPRFEVEPTPTNVERNFYDTLLVLRKLLQDEREIGAFVGERLAASGARLRSRHRTRRDRGPQLAELYGDRVDPGTIPAKLTFSPGDRATLRAALGETLCELNKVTNGALFGAAADLLGSTSVSKLGQDFPAGFFNAVGNPAARLIATGGICEDCMGAFMSGLSAYGEHIGVGSSYGAFIVALQHVAARLHSIGQQALNATFGVPYRTFVVVAAHAGLKTGEDGATHADPQALQLVQENFPAGTCVTLTPWDPQELWPLTTAALRRRPAVLVPFVTRPTETIVDRAALRLPPATASVKGVYAFRRADHRTRPYHGTLVLQGSEVATAFVDDVLPRLDDEGLNMNIFYVASAELFSALPQPEQDAIFPPELAAEAMGVSGFTLPTMYRWITSREGRARTLHAFARGHYLGSGQAHKVLQEAGLHAEGQWQAIREYAQWIAARN